MEKVKKNDFTKNPEGFYYYVNPYTKFKELSDDNKAITEEFIDNLEFDSVYVHPRKIAVPSHKDRPLYKLRNKNNPKKSIIRKLRGKNCINGDNIVFDTISSKELEIENNDEVELKKIRFYERYTAYLWNHPKEDIRIAYKLFLLGMLIGVASVVISIIGL